MNPIEAAKGDFVHAKGALLNALRQSGKGVVRG